MLRHGDSLGPYEILAHESAGGMASLYRARRDGPAGFSREVAIKVVHPHLALDPAFVRMFLDEARLAARIRHPNVVQVEELGCDDGTYFLVMNYVPSRSLSAVLRGLERDGARLAIEEVVHIAAALSDGLHAAHETRGEDGEPLGVVHRDVSPENVLLGRDGHVTLIDFGIARARGRVQETASGEVRGKLRYMAPEQLSRGPVDRRTDVFALGVVLHRMAVGALPFDGESDAQVLAQILASEGPLPTGIAALDPVLARALAPRPADRFATARALRDALLAAWPLGPTRGAAALEQRMAALFTEAPRVAEAPRTAAVTAPRATVSAAVTEPRAVTTSPRALIATSSRAVTATSPRALIATSPTPGSTLPSARSWQGAGWSALVLVVGLTLWGLASLEGSASPAPPPSETPRPEAPPLEAPLVEAPPLEAPPLEAPRVEAPRVEEGPESTHASEPAPEEARETAAPVVRRRRAPTPPPTELVDGVPIAEDPGL